MSAPTCEVFANWDGKPPWCGKPAAVMLRGGCVHEHVQRWVPVCAKCERCIKTRLASGPFVCLICQNGPDPHECPAQAEWGSLEVAAR